MKRSGAIKKRPLWQPLPDAAVRTMLKDIAGGRDGDGVLKEALALSHEALRISHYDRPAWLLAQLQQRSVALAVELASALGTDMKTLERQSFGVFEFKRIRDEEMEAVPW